MILNEYNKQNWLKLANNYIKKKDYVRAIYYYEKLGYMENVANLYLKIGDWSKASDIFFNIGLTKQATEIETKGRNGEYK